jgi:hypothetical protein
LKWVSISSTSAEPFIVERPFISGANAAIGTRNGHSSLTTIPLESDQIRAAWRETTTDPARSAATEQGRTDKLHSFRKTTNATPRADIDLAESRYRNAKKDAGVK